MTLGGTTGFSSEIETGGCTGAVGFEPPEEPGADVPVVGAPLDEPDDDPGALDCEPDEQPASAPDTAAARATAATTFLMRTILANRAKGPCELTP
ncbi:hypothetical protein UK23_37860 [Lentzea aerocolonigenes]|uniref:Uncharacterized protein n=1 Tax=Lentzea aerocolonigenes TaxID=68170 RepID=A0A0F0GIF8_LENAE|nr:hypothetical protein UK23_37860 [Lentzea aerocolonigenes]